MTQTNGKAMGAFGLHEEVEMTSAVDSYIVGSFPTKKKRIQISPRGICRRNINVRRDFTPSHALQSAMDVQQTATTKYILANGTKLACRRLGTESGIPLVMMMHFRGNMDFWDPAFINALAKSRAIIPLDNVGIGKSEGEIPTTLHGWAKHVIALVQALNITQIDLLSFSMGGGAAQYVALAAPNLVRKLVCAGTRTSRTPKTVIGPRDIFCALTNAVTEEEFRAAWALSSFNHDTESQAAAKASWERIFSRQQDRSPHLSPELAKRQTEAFTKFSMRHPANSYERIRDLTMSVFVANGDNDLLIPTENSVELAKLLPSAHLHIYPNPSH